jgi:glycosyltransferase involved in cell wall biosynthesis
MTPVHGRLGRRYRQVHKLWREGGSTAVWNRIRYSVAERLAPKLTHLPVLPEDVRKADLTTPPTWPSLPREAGRPLVVNWVTTPPAPGSGGHATMFRLIRHLQDAGYDCRIFIYDVFGNDTIYCRSLVKTLFPWFDGPVEDVRGGMPPAHAVIATSWPTAYPAYNDPCAGKRFYLVQDFEPWFYPVGSQSVFAENTYRMGFHAITAGKYLARKLATEYGMQSGWFDFGCDTQHYRLLNGGARDSIVFYAKPGAPRRAFELGAMALELFSKRHPDVHIHLYGSYGNSLPVKFTDHGVLRPNELNDIYNRCFAGLSLSMTNVSLVPHEMLSAGCVPVVNDAVQNREVLENAYVRYAAPEPHALAAALHEVVATADFGRLAQAAAASVKLMKWEKAGEQFEQCLRTGMAGEQCAASSALKSTPRAARA